MSQSNHVGRTPVSSQNGAITKEQIYRNMNLIENNFKVVSILRGASAGSRTNTVVAAINMLSSILAMPLNWLPLTPASQTIVSQTPLHRIISHWKLNSEPNVRIKSD